MTEYESYCRKILDELPWNWQTAKACVLLYEFYRLGMKKSDNAREKAMNAINSGRMQRGKKELYAVNFH